MPCPRQAASTSSESVATRRSVRSGDRRARAYTWQSIGRPAMSRSTLRGSRVDCSRAGMTPRTSSPAAISGLDGVPRAPSRGRQEAQVVDDADERPALGQAPVGVLGRAAMDAGNHAAAPGRGEQPLHHRLELGVLRLEGRREPGRGAEVARARVAGVEAGDGEDVVDPADRVNVLDLGDDQDLVVGAAEVGLPMLSQLPTDGVPARSFCLTWFGVMRAAILADSRDRVTGGGAVPPGTALPRGRPG